MVLHAGLLKLIAVTNASGVTTYKLCVTCNAWSNKLVVLHLPRKQRPQDLTCTTDMRTAHQGTRMHTASTHWYDSKQPMPLTPRALTPHRTGLMIQTQQVQGTVSHSLSTQATRMQ